MKNKPTKSLMKSISWTLKPTSLTAQLLKWQSLKPSKKSREWLKKKSTLINSLNVLKYSTKINSNPMKRTCSAIFWSCCIISSKKRKFLTFCYKNKKQICQKRDALILLANTLTHSSYLTDGSLTAQNGWISQLKEWVKDFFLQPAKLSSTTWSKLRICKTFMKTNTTKKWSKTFTKSKTTKTLFFTCYWSELRPGLAKSRATSLAKRSISPSWITSTDGLKTIESLPIPFTPWVPWSILNLKYASKSLKNNPKWKNSSKACDKILSLRLLSNLAVASLPTWLTPMTMSKKLSEGTILLKNLFLPSKKASKTLKYQLSSNFCGHWVTCP